jgi:hypothetical protein
VQLEDAWEELKRGGGIDWIAGTYASKSKTQIIFHEKGSGGFDALRNIMHDDVILYAALRITVDKMERFISIAWVGEDIGFMRGYVSMHKQAVRCSLLHSLT